MTPPKRRFDWENAERAWVAGETQASIARRVGVKRQAVTFALRMLRERRASGVRPRGVPPGRGLDSHCSVCGETGHDRRRHRAAQEVAHGTP